MRSLCVLLGLVFCCATFLNSVSCQYVAPNSAFPPYGCPQSSMNGLFPNTEERQAHVWYNFVRQAPIYFRDNYIKPYMGSGDTSANNILTGSAYTGVRKPIPYNINLGRSARAHVVDRLNPISCGDTYPHDDCNGTTTGTRIGKFYKGYGWGEIWSGPFPNPKNGTYPFAGIASFICDGSYWFTSSSLSLYSCAADGSGADGHRNIIMNQNGEVGCGIINNGSYSDYSCDSGPTQISAYKVQIYSGAHLYVPPSSTQYTYTANFYSTTAPTSAIVIVDGLSRNLTLVAGNTTNGIYRSAASTFTSTEACHAYYFQFTVNGVTEKYPASGAFQTNFIGSCRTDWANSTSVVSS